MPLSVCSDLSHGGKLEKSAGIRLVTGPSMAPTVALLNLRVKPFDDVRARRAVGGYGIDREEIAKVVFHGRVQPLVSVLPPGVPDAINLNEMYPYNPGHWFSLMGTFLPFEIITYAI